MHTTNTPNTPIFKRSFVILAATLVVGLSGCAVLSPAERSVQMQQEVDEMIQVYGPACERLGYKPDSDPWRECILKLNTSKNIERYNTQTTTQCWGHRGFYHCTTF